MIKRLEDTTLFNKLRSGHCRRRILSNYHSYGCEYDFCSFYDFSNIGIISAFNSSAALELFDGAKPDSEALTEAARFIVMLSPDTIELPNDLPEIFTDITASEYDGLDRVHFEFADFCGSEETITDDMPLSKVWNVLLSGFPELEDAYELWYADASHRIRHGTERIYSLGGVSVAAVKYTEDGVAFVGDVSTLSSERGKGNARKLLYAVGKKLSQEGLKPVISALNHRVGFYDEIGFRRIYTDKIYKKKQER